VQNVSDNDHGNDDETPAGRGENEDEVDYYGEEEEDLVMSDEEQQFYLQGTNVRSKDMRHTENTMILGEREIEGILATFTLIIDTFC